MESVEATDDKTVVFKLKGENDQTFAQILVTSAGPIVDEETYPADKKIDDEAAVKANGFSGPYTIGKYDKNQLAEFKANPDYDGTYGKATEKAVTMKYYAKAENLKLDIENGDIDVAFRSLTPTDIEDLDKADGLKVYTGAGGELRYIVFNLKTMPGDNEEQKLAIRKAVASSVDREALSTDVYKETFTPAYSMVPQGQKGATEPFKDAVRRDARQGQGREVPQRCRRRHPGRRSSCSTTPTTTARTPTRSTTRSSVSSRRPDCSRSTCSRRSGRRTRRSRRPTPTRCSSSAGSRTSRTPTTTCRRSCPSEEPGQLHQLALQRPEGDDLEDPAMTKLLDEQRTEADKAAREAKLGEVQQRLAEQVPFLPLLTGSQVAVARDGVTGADKTLDASFKFRFTSLSKK